MLSGLRYDHVPWKVCSCATLKGFCTDRSIHSLLEDRFNAGGAMHFMLQCSPYSTTADFTGYTVKCFLWVGTHSFVEQTGT